MFFFFFLLETVEIEVLHIETRSSGDRYSFSYFTPSERSLFFSNETGQKKCAKSSVLLVTNPSIIIVYMRIYSCVEALEFCLLFHGFVNRLIRYFTCIGGLTRWTIRLNSFHFRSH